MEAALRDVHSKTRPRPDHFFGQFLGKCRQNACAHAQKGYVLVLVHVIFQVILHLNFSDISTPGGCFM